jgi:hypothetical protein
LGVPRPGLRGTKPFGMARGAPGISVGTGTATLATAAAGEPAGRPAGSDLPLADAGRGAGEGLTAGDVLTATEGLFADGAEAGGDGARAAGALRPAPPFAGVPLLPATVTGADFLVLVDAGALFLAPAAFLAIGLLFAAGFLATTGFFLAAGAGRLLAAERAGAAFFAVGRALGAAAFFDVFLTTGFFTGSPRNGGATFSRKARREGRDRFRPPRIVVTQRIGAAKAARASPTV